MKIRRLSSISLAALLFLSGFAARVCAANPRAVSLYNLGLTAYKQGSPESAVIFFKRAVDIDPDLADAHYNLGLIYLAQKRYADALKCFENVLRVNPSDTQAPQHIAKCRQALGMDGTQTATGFASSPAEQLPQTQQPQLVPQRQSVPVSSSTTPTAQAQQGNPHAISMYNLGLNAYKQGSFETAIIFFKRAADIDPDLADAQYNLGVIYLSQKRYKEALPCFEEVLRVKPSDTQAPQHIAKCRQALGAGSAQTAAAEPQPQVVQQPQIAQPQVAPQPQVVQPPQVVTQAQPVPVVSNTTPPPTVSYQKVNQPINDKWALVIGISKFANPAYNLKYAAKDARDFYDYLITEAGFRKDHVLLLIDEMATQRNITDAFGDNFLPAVSEPGDMVVVYVSTHGTPSSKDKGGRNYIVAYDTDVTKLYSTGVKMDDLDERIKEGVKTERALIIMDTCFSGAGIPGSKGLVQFDNFDARLLAQGCGHRVITSSSPNERSWESNNAANGVFTKYLLQALRANQGKVDVKSAFGDLQAKVTWEVKSAFSASQTPQLGGEWEGNEMILSAPATKPRQIFNSELIRLMNAAQKPTSGKSTSSPAAPVRK